MPHFSFSLFVLFVWGFRDQLFKNIYFELDDVLLDDPVRSVFELECRHDFSSGVVNDLDQTGRSRPVAVPKLESAQTGTDPLENTILIQGDFDWNEAAFYRPCSPTSDNWNLMYYSNSGNQHNTPTAVAKRLFLLWEYYA